MKELHVYDFDGTLYRSPLPPSAAENAVWWHLPRSLDGAGMPGFDHRWVLPVVIEARRSLEDPRVLTVLLTGRPNHRAMRDRITHLLQGADLRFRHMQLRPIMLRESTAQYKAGFVKGVLKSIPTIQKVVYYDDDPENLDEVGKVVRAAGKTYRAELGPGCL